MVLRRSGTFKGFNNDIKTSHNYIELKRLYSYRRIFSLKIEQNQITSTIRGLSNIKHIGYIFVFVSFPN